MNGKGEILAGILKNYNDCCFFLHNTKELTIVGNILEEGFIFESQLSHSTDRVNPNEPIEITYFLFQRKEYGTYTIIIAIPRRTYDHYSAVSLQESCDIEDVISSTEPFYGENDEMVYTISPQHILGYFNIRTNEFIKNKLWDPGFDNSSSKSPKPKLARTYKK